MDIQALEMIELQVLSDLSKGKNPGAASSSMKIRGSETSQKIDHLGVEALAWYAAPFEPEARLLGHNEPTVTPEWGITAMPLYLNNRAVHDLCRLQRGPAQYHRQGGARPVSASCGPPAGDRLVMESADRAVCR